MNHAETLYCSRKPQAAPLADLAAVFVMPLISASYGTFNYLQNLEILHERWYSLWTQHTLFYSMLFFLPWWRPMRPTCGGWSIWALLEFNYGRPVPPTGSVFGQVLRGV